MSAVRAAFDGVTHASVVLPLVFTPEVVDVFVRNVIAAAQAAGVRKLVFNASTRVPQAKTGLPAFETRRDAEKLILASGIPSVVLRPPVYLDNLCSPWVAGAIVRDGVLAYPLPADFRTAWLSHDDLAEATAAALRDDTLSGTVIELGGPDAVTGTELAAVFAEVLGRDVSYLPLPVDGFEAGLASVAGDEAAAGVASLYRWLADAPEPEIYAADAPTIEKTLGIRLTPIRAWIAAQPWPELSSR